MTTHDTDKFEKCFTNTILMVEPVAFGYNAETAVNNFFQYQPDATESEVQRRALIEFNQMVDVLRSAGIEVITVQDTRFPHKPDSIFPNNWISFHLNNHVVFYPMFAENRRLERRMDILLEIENRMHRKFHYTDYSASEMEGIFLEGTGSYVPDRKNRIAYACLSPRTDERLFRRFCDENNFRPVVFHATQRVGDVLKPVYHTNVVMCVAQSFVVVCLEAIRDVSEREMLIAEINNSKKELIEITENQMNSFAGNMIQLRSEKGQLCLAMSQAAFDSLTPAQIAKLELENKLLVFPIPTIEKHGGGSVRCMIAEIF